MPCPDYLEIHINFNPRILVRFEPAAELHAFERQRSVAVAFATDDQHAAYVDQASDGGSRRRRAHDGVRYLESGLGALVSVGDLSQCFLLPLFLRNNAHTTYEFER